MNGRDKRAEAEARREIARIAASGSLAPASSARSSSLWNSSKKQRRFSCKTAQAQHDALTERKFNEELQRLRQSGSSRQTQPAAAGTAAAGNSQGNMATGPSQGTESAAGCRSTGRCSADGCCQNGNDGNTLLEELYCSEAAAAAVEQIDKMQDGKPVQSF